MYQCIQLYNVTIKPPYAAFFVDNLGDKTIGQSASNFSNFIPCREFFNLQIIQFFN